MNKNANQVNIDNVIFLEIKLYIRSILKVDETLLKEY